MFKEANIHMAYKHYKIDLKSHPCTISSSIPSPHFPSQVTSVTNFLCVFPMFLYTDKSKCFILLYPTKRTALLCRLLTEKEANTACPKQGKSRGRVFWESSWGLPLHPWEAGMLEKGQHLLEAWTFPCRFPALIWSIQSVTIQVIPCHLDLKSYSA
jgi:hypothetical protein